MSTIASPSLPKKIGFGSLSFLLSLLWFVLNLGGRGRPAIGDSVLLALGIDPWSAGTARLHYTIFYSIPLVLLSAALGFRFPTDLGAAIGRNAAILIGLLTVFFGLFALRQ